MTDYKQLCAELLKGYEILLGDLKFDNRLAKRARAALAEPEPEGPTDDELFAVAEAYAEDNGLIGLHNAPDFARAVLARWGNRQGILDSSTPQPAVGEVAELVDLIRQNVALAWEPAACMLGNMTAGELTRAAELLEQLNPPQPVPVSERLPGPGDCTTNPRTGEGQWCWGWVQHDPIPYSGRWRMIRREWLVDEAKAWLPAHALPLPS